MPEWLLSLFVNAMLIAGGLVSIAFLLFLVVILCVEIYDLFTTTDEDLDELERRYLEED